MKFIFPVAPLICVGIIAGLIAIGEAAVASNMAVAHTNVSCTTGSVTAEGGWVRVALNCGDKRTHFNSAPTIIVARAAANQSITVTCQTYKYKDEASCTLPKTP